MVGTKKSLLAIVATVAGIVTLKKVRNRKAKTAEAEPEETTT